MLLFASLFLALPLALQADEGPSKLEPSASASTATAFWSKSNHDLRYMWMLPEGYSEEKPRHMTIILHGTGGDYRWGYWNNFTPRHVTLNPLRAGDIIISVDGTSPGGNDTRLFLSGKKDIESFATFLAEMRERFAVDQIYLYGHSQGAFFVTLFASHHPDLVGGVVAHAGGIWNGVKLGRKMKDVPVVFLHATKEPVVPLLNSVGGRDAMLDAGLELTTLLRMPGYNHWPNSMRVSEAIDWCEGMTSTDPERVLELAKELARHKGPDSYQYEITPALGLSYQVAMRLMGSERSDYGIDEVPLKIAAQGKDLTDAINKHGKAMVKELKKSFSRKLTLDGDKPLGMLLAVREDYRGVPSVEEWYGDMGFDKTLKKQRKKASKLYDAYWQDTPAAEAFATTVDLLEDTFLIEDLPWNLSAKMEEWHEDARTIDIDKKALAKFKTYEAWKEAWDLGNKEYKKLWMKWEWED